MGYFLSLRGARVQEVKPTLGDTSDIEMQRLLGSLLSNRHLTLGATGDIHWLLRMTVAIDVGHALLRSQLGLLVAMLVICGLRVEAAKATALRGETRMTGMA